MLPGGLVRAKVQQRAIEPSYVDPGKPAIKLAAEQVTELFSAAARDGLAIGEVNAALDDLCEERRDHRMVRGLAHLARAKTTVEAPEEGAVEPATLRAEAFALAAARGPVVLDERHGAICGRPTAQAVLTEVGAAHGLGASQVARLLYADLPSEHRVTACDVPDPTWLVHRYNVALVQGLLAKAREVRVHLADATTPRLRQLFRWIKFHQLLCRASRNGSGLDLVLDGPMSLFQGSTRYGRSLARFFPALLLQDAAWTLEATVLWTRAQHRKSLVVDHTHGLVSHYADTGAYRSRAVQHLEARFPEARTGWDLHDGQEPVVLGGELLLPDFHAQRDGRIAHLEILGTWRPEQLEKRLTQLGEPGAPPLVLAVSKKLAGGRGKAVPDHPRVVGFADVLAPKRLAEAFDRVAAPVP